jgi:hypothetical protein
MSIHQGGVFAPAQEGMWQLLISSVTGRKGGSSIPEIVGNGHNDERL